MFLFTKTKTKTSVNEKSTFLSTITIA